MGNQANRHTRPSLSQSERLSQRGEISSSNWCADGSKQTPPTPTTQPQNNCGTGSLRCADTNVSGQKCIILSSGRLQFLLHFYLFRHLFQKTCPFSEPPLVYKRKLCDDGVSGSSAEGWEQEEAYYAILKSAGCENTRERERDVKKGGYCRRVWRGE